jgi:hypothetical protein
MGGKREEAAVGGTRRCARRDHPTPLEPIARKLTFIPRASPAAASRPSTLPGAERQFDQRRSSRELARDELLDRLARLLGLRPILGDPFVHRVLEEVVLARSAGGPVGADELLNVGDRRSTSFKPGKPGGPGRLKKKAEEKATAIAKKAIADVKAAAKDCTEDAIKTLKSVMKDESKPAAARVGAAIAILDRGWGKPMQAVEANVSLFDQMTDDEQSAMLAALQALKDC